MECKNCTLILEENHNFCADCGAKVIRNRLTIKNLFGDFAQRYLNIDNTFIRTFGKLFIAPEVVIVGYINGARKRYMNPISYFTIAVFLGGIFFFLVQKFFPTAMDFQFTQMATDNSDESQKLGMEFGKKFQDISIEYQSIFYMAMLPFLSLISRVVFYNKKQFNLSEHFVINIYAYSQMSILVNILYILSIWNSQWIYYVSMSNAITLVLYFSYVYKKTFQLSFKQILLKLLLFLVIFGILFLGIIICAAIYLAFFTDTFKNLKNAQAMLY
ncbi:DUF3667 domain-containing protein [Cellulophaga sp. HaHa_2_1]|uniref:DUF3667 domain-containing protein n=1 Tax=Cellulophaga sp. HaHa_2_1 TaxID=2749994 RepID=UPI001C4E9CDD|nr:DUF3667 domain-containing protein [Cellulophaga sp. HaHa_2_1]QXP53931.1 DUF3667 domain-containing protein [Cellulophaga sp. HaHa_2_1]